MPVVIWSRVIDAGPKIDGHYHAGLRDLECQSGQLRPRFL